VVSSQKGFFSFSPRETPALGSSRFVATNVCVHFLAFSDLRSRTIGSGPLEKLVLVLRGDIAGRFVRPEGRRTRAVGHRRRKKRERGRRFPPAWWGRPRLAQLNSEATRVGLVAAARGSQDRLGGNGFREFFADPLAELFVGFSRLVGHPVWIKLVDHTFCPFK
jgi:hypothetical protein